VVGSGLELHIEQPHAPTSWRQFVREYAMIVLSIMTALGLEHVAVAMHDADAARASKARIEVELAKNLSDLERAETTNEGHVAKASETMKALVEGIKAGTADQAATLALLGPMFEHFQIALPSWQRDAWDAAIADQSAGHLAPEDLRRYAEIYSSARDIAAGAQLLLGGEWLTRATELGVDFRLGTVDARTTAHTLARFLVAAQEIAALQKSLDTLIATGKSNDGGGVAAAH
jgi:hypothetical protein